jgi:hypothetical protein
MFINIMVCARISVTNKADHNKTKGRLRHRQEENIKLDAKETGWIETEFIWLQWWTLLTLAISFWVPKKVRTFLIW